MADDVNRLMVMVEANTRSYENAMKKIQKVTDTGFSGAAQKVKNYNRQINRSGMAVGNLAAQFNDIGVTVAAGQSPLQIALQQGTQIGQVFTQTGADVKGAGKLIASSLAAVVSPINLITIGLIAGGSALAQWAMSASDADSEIEGLDKRLKEARTSITNLNSELRGLRLGVSPEEVALMDAVAKQSKVVLDARKQMAVIQPRLLSVAQNTYEAEKETLDALEAELSTLQRLQLEKESLKKQTIETADAERLLGEQMAYTSRELSQNDQIAGLLKAGVKATTIEAIELAGVDLSSPIISATDAAKLLEIGLSDSQIAAIELAGTSISEPIRIAADEAARLAENLFLASRAGLREDLADEDALFSQKVIPDASVRANQRQAVNNFSNLTRSRKSKSSRSTNVSAVKREQNAINELIKSLEVEIDLVGASDLVKRQVNATRNLGASATLEQIARVEQLTAKLYAEEQAWGNLQDAQETTRSFIHDLKDGLMAGEDAWETFGNAAISALDKITDKLLDDVLNAMFKVNNAGSGSGGGGLLGKLFGGLFGGAAVDPWAGLRSFDGGGYTGTGLRSGGLDGKGGFPALLHPNETVVDHTRGGGMSGKNLHLTATVHVTTDDEKFRGEMSQVAIGVVGEASPHIVERSTAAANRQLARGGFDGAMAQRYGSQSRAFKR